MTAALQSGFASGSSKSLNQSEMEITENKSIYKEYIYFFKHTHTHTHTHTHIYIYIYIYIYIK